MKNKINISLLLISIFTLNFSFCNEKFVKIKGSVSHNSIPITNFSIHLNFDNIDSSQVGFEKENFELWLPANRKAKVSFVKEGFVILHMVVDASFIPSFAYKKKQSIEFNVKMVKIQDLNKNQLKPFCVASFKASENTFILAYTNTVIKKFRAPFPTPLSTFTGAKPVNKYLPTVSKINKNNSRKSHAYFQLVQGILFSNLNYSVFNEKTDKANKYLDELTDLDKDSWGNIKPFDTPEYAAIVLKTIHNEKTKDTLFALGSWVGTSQLLFQSFTSNSKLIIHGKKLSYLLKYYKEAELNEEQKLIVASLRNMAILYDELVRNYMTAMKKKSPLKLAENTLFLQIKSENQTIYNTIIQ